MRRQCHDCVTARGRDRDRERPGRPQPGGWARRRAARRGNLTRITGIMAYATSTQSLSGITSKSRPGGPEPGPSQAGPAGWTKHRPAFRRRHGESESVKAQLGKGPAGRAPGPAAPGEAPLGHPPTVTRSPTWQGPAPAGETKFCLARATSAWQAGLLFRLDCGPSLPTGIPATRLGAYPGLDARHQLQVRRTRTSPSRGRRFRDAVTESQ